MRILIFGDSIAYGEYDSRAGWANRLYVEYLNRQARDLAGDHPFIFNLSVPSQTTRDIIKRLSQEVAARRYPGEEFAFVFTIGINDSRRKGDTHEPISSPQQYADDLQELFEAARKHGKKILFVGLTPVEDEKFATNKYESARIWEFEQVLRAFVIEKDVPFVPLFEEFQTRMENGETLFLDGLHPNDAGHDLMYEQIRPKLAAITKP